MTHRFRTPMTRLSWSTLAEWHHCAMTLRARPPTRGKYERIEAHIRALPKALIDVTRDREALTVTLSLLASTETPFGRPLRGLRADAPHTPLIMALQNRLAQLRSSQIALECRAR